MALPNIGTRKLQQTRDRDRRVHVPERDTIERLRSPGPSGLNPESKAWCLIGGLGGGEGAREDSACCFFSFRGLYSSRREVFANLSSGEVHMMVGDASRQRCPLEEGMRPEDQERGRDRKKKKWERQTRSLFVAFYEGVLFVEHPCVCMFLYYAIQIQQYSKPEQQKN